MAQTFRLPRGGRIDRRRAVTFSLNGRLIEAFAGDTVASALLANGIHLVGRSFKYHRPRGILSHGSDEPNALLHLDRGAGRADPNNRATVAEAAEGLIAGSQNHWPSLEHDFGAINDLLSPLLAAGFYYKTFMWPRSFWNRVYEPRIRSAAGLGVAPEAPDPDRYTHRFAHCEVLVIGAGPAGLAAALASSQGNQRVMLVDEQMELGGSLLHESHADIDGEPAAEWLARSLKDLKSRENVVLLPRATAVGYYNHNFLAIAERLTDHLGTGNDRSRDNVPRERLRQVRARRVVIATGAHERPLVFPDNDRPGIMLAESIRVYVNRFAVAPGRQVVIATNGSSAYQVAADLKDAGIGVTLVDTRRYSACEPDIRGIHAKNIEVLPAHTVIGSTGRKRVNGLQVAPLDDAGNVGKRRTLPCDCVGLSGGWTPAVHLFSQSRGKLRFDAAIDAFVPDTSAQSEQSAGACNGVYELSDCLNEGWRAGIAAAGEGNPHSFSVEPPARHGFQPIRSLPTDGDTGKTRAFVDFQNDVTARDVALALREGFESVEHVKRYTTTGMATDQGKTSNMLALGLISEALARPIPEVGTTTYRPPYTPVTFGTLVGPSRGNLFEPIRQTPIHDWSVRHGATFENVALWRRPWFFPRSGEDKHRAVNRECKAVRASVGIFDASTLGKIEVVGPDAAEFLNRMYVNEFTHLPPGRCKYGLMLREDGYICDDGVVACIAPGRFHVTTTTNGAARVLSMMEDYLQTEWPTLNVFLTSITEQWAVIALQGPRARDVLAPLVTDIDLSPNAFPHMSVRTGHIGGSLARLFRVSFTGELGYEINVPAGYAARVWDAVFSSGQPFGITPYGTETMHVLRAERGFIIVGQDTDGTVTPHDLGLGKMIAREKTDFIGKRSLTRPDMLATNRKQLVGLRTSSPNLVLDEGAQVVAGPHQSMSMKAIGHVTSSYWSENCGCSIALALIAGGRTMLGQSVQVTTPAGFAEARVTASVFVDPEAIRVHG